MYISEAAAAAADFDRCSPLATVVVVYEPSDHEGPD